MRYWSSLKNGVMYGRNGERAELLKIEEHGAEYGWVSPMTRDDIAYIKHFRSVFKRYNINPSKATRLDTTS